jgi:murein DD-endopeptidase MepM/ murein hydrolase activator NlpD
MKKKFRGLKLGLMLCLVVGIACTSFGDLQEEEEKKEQMEQELKDTTTYLESLNALKGDSEAYIQALDSQLGKIAMNIYDLQQQAVAKQVEIDEKSAAIAAKEIEIDGQYSDMALRIQYMYENGDAQYASMILDSSDISDLLNRATYIAELTQYDRNMLEELKASKAELETQKTELEAGKTELEGLLAEAVAEQQAHENILAAKQSEIETYKNEIYDANLTVEDLLDGIKDQEILIEQIKEYNRQQALLQQQQNVIYDGGRLQWPLPGISRISSYFGNRDDPLNPGTARYHYGIDIPAVTGTTIYAAYSGRVAWASYHYSAGNWIGIDHGNGVMTVYMHMSGFLVSAGDYVNTGDPIGLVGSTGGSTGPHLHFGVSINGTYQNPLDYVIIP